MKLLLSTILTLALSSVAASAITVATPADGAQVTSPFNLIASTAVCGSVPAVSMGYSIDHDKATIVPTSFSALVVATQGPHVLHVKCWGVKAASEVLLSINVVPAKTTDVTVASPANGATVTSPFNLTASVTTCGSAPATALGYSVDGGSTALQPTSFSTTVKANPGSHVLRVKCIGQGSTDQVTLNVHVVPPPTAATPVFSLMPGQYSTKQTVRLSDATPGATIYFTTDNSAPSVSSLPYSGPITISASTVIQAIAVAPGYGNSRTAAGQYLIKAPTGATIPPNATKQADIHLMPNWRIKHDPGTPGNSSGAISIVGDPSLSGQSNRFITSFTDAGGELYSLTYANDPDAKNFVYDAQVWIEEGSSISNLEMDNNQVMANGDTVIYAFQCSGFAGVWEYSANVGTRTNPVVKWLRSDQPCNPANWTPNMWHHVQISYSRDDAGNVTYHSAWFDGVEAPINQTVNSDFSLGWAKGVLVTNFQVDGIGVSGSATLYLDNLTFYRW